MQGTKHSIPGQGTEIPHATWHGQKKKEKIEMKAHCEETKQWTNLDLEVIYLLKLDGDFKRSMINVLNAPIWKGKNMV